MKHAQLFVFAAFALTACSANPDDGKDRIYADEILQDDEAQDTDKAPETLAGAWRVAGIDGEALNLPTALTLQAGSQILRWDPACADVMYEYSIDGSRFRADRIRYSMDENSDPSLVMPPPCAIALPPGMDIALAALAAADTIERTETNGVRLSGNGRSVTLFSQ